MIQLCAELVQIELCFYKKINDIVLNSLLIKALN